MKSFLPPLFLTADPLMPGLSIPPTDGVLVNRLGPTLDINFLNSPAPDPRITVTRAGTATYCDASGTIQIASANTGRMDYDPVTLAPKGMLIEESRTNLFLQSEALNTSWGLAEATVSANVVTSPSNTLTADTVVPSTNNAFHIVYQASAAVTSGAVVTLSLYAKPAGYSFLWMRFGDSGAAAVCQGTINLSTGVFTQGPTASGAGAVLAASSITNAGNGWYRITITGSVTGVTNYTTFLYPMQASPAATFAGNGTSGVAMWGVQLELGSFPTSYIPTTTTTVTRAADVANMPTGSWYSAGIWSMEAEFSVPSLPGLTVAGISELNDNSANNRVFLALSATTGTGRINDIIATVGQGVATTANSASTSVTNKLALSQAVSAAALCLNGSAIVGVAWAGGLPSGLNQMQIGGLASLNYLNGNMKRLRFWNRALTTFELQQVSS